MSHADAAASERLTVAVRELVATIVGRSLPGDALDAATAAVQAINTDLGSRGEQRGRSRSRPSRGADPWDHFHLSPISGLSNPLAPPMSFRAEDGKVIAECVFNVAYQGPPGCVHGAFVAAVFDELLGIANAVAKHPAMTGKLEVRYLRPTPLDVPLQLIGQHTGVSGRRVFASGTMLAGGVVTAEAEGVFVEITPAQAARIFGPEAAEQAS